MSTTLRKSIESCGVTRYRIAKETGIGQSVLSRFMTGKTSLSLDAVDTLAAFMGLELVPRGEAGELKPATASGSKRAKAKRER